MSLNIKQGGTGSTTAATARTNLGLGTGAIVDVPASGDASSSQLAKGSDSRLVKHLNVIADSASLGNSNTETDLYTHTLLAAEVPVGCTIEVEGSVFVSDGTGGKSLTTRLYVGGVVVATGTSIPATNAYHLLGSKVTIRATGAHSAPYVGKSATASPWTAAQTPGLATLTPSSDLIVKMTAQWASASATCVCNGRMFDINVRQAGATS